MSNRSVGSIVLKILEYTIIVVIFFFMYAKIEMLQFHTDSIYRQLSRGKMATISPTEEKFDIVTTHMGIFAVMFENFKLHGKDKAKVDLNVINLQSVDFTNCTVKIFYEEGSEEKIINKLPSGKMKKIKLIIPYSTPEARIKILIQPEGLLAPLSK